MKTEQIKKFLNKTITYKTIWNTYETAKLIEIRDCYATFEKQNNKIHIKTFNILQIEEVL
jgi:hypothetical protein